MTSRHGDQDEDRSDQPPFRPAPRRGSPGETPHRTSGGSRNSDEGLAAVVPPRSIGHKVSQGDGDMDSLHSPRRSVSRVVSQGLLSRPNPGQQDPSNDRSSSRSRSPMHATTTKKRSPRSNENTPIGKPTPIRKPNEHEKQISEKGQRPASNLKLQHSSESSEKRSQAILLDKRAPPRSLIVTEEAIRPEPKRQASKRPWNLLQHIQQQDQEQSTSSLSIIDAHFLMLAQLDSQDQLSGRKDVANAASGHSKRSSSNQTSARSNIDREPAHRETAPDPVKEDVSLPPLVTPQHDRESYWEEDLHREAQQRPQIPPMGGHHRPVASQGDNPIDMEGEDPLDPHPEDDDNNPAFAFDHNRFPLDYFEFADLCSRAGNLRPNAEFYTDEDYVEHDRSWDPVRHWLQLHGQAEVIVPYLEVANDQGQNALHICCRKQPPHDVIFHLIQTLHQSNRLGILHARDADGRTPLHLACANSAPPDTLRELANWSSDILRAKDRNGLTPLHNALIGPFRRFPDLIDLLASTGAAEVTGFVLQGSDFQVLPLHYACVFGAAVETLRVLRGKYPEGMTQADAEGRTPLHWALLSCKQAPEATPLTVRFLLNEEPSLVNMASANTPDPLVYLLTEVVNKDSKTFSEGKIGTEALVRQEAARQCFTMLSDTKCMLDAEGNLQLHDAVFRELRRAPQWIFPTAILSRKVQDTLDRKMKARFPTVVLMLDLYVQAMVMVAYIWNVEQSLDLRGAASTMAETQAGENNPPSSLRRLPQSSDAYIPLADLGFLYLGGTYFLLRELVQIVSLVWEKSLMTVLQGWVFNLADWLDLAYIVAIFIWASILNQGLIDDLYAFSNAAALSAGILWMKLFTFLRTISFDFSVFVSGVLYVLQRLIPYMILLLFFMAAFTQIFNTMFISNPDYGCVSTPEEKTLQDMEDEMMDMRCFWEKDSMPFCSRWESFLRVYTMFLGEVDERDFADSKVATFFFIVFMLLMVILLSNVLIAIVTGYYKQVQDERGILVFYTDRLYFLAEVDSIKAFPILRRTATDPDDPATGARARDNWRILTDMLMMRRQRNGVNRRRHVAPELRSFSYEQDMHFWDMLSGGGGEEEQSQASKAFTQFCRCIGAVVMMFGWFISGLLTVGMAWPPQIREWFFSSATTKRSLAETVQEMEENRGKEEWQVTEEVAKAKDEFRNALVDNRKHLDTHKASINNMKLEIRKEMRQLKIKTQMLLEVLDKVAYDAESRRSMGSVTTD